MRSVHHHSRVAPQTFSRALRRLPDVKVMDESKRQKLMPEEQEAQQKHMGAAKIYFAATTIPGASCVAIHHTRGRC